VERHRIGVGSKDVSAYEALFTGLPDMVRKVASFLRRLLVILIGDVPADSARCEYICSKPDCSPEDYDNCIKRMDYQDLRRDN
jgi:hypothetical protein